MRKRSLSFLGLSCLLTGCQAPLAQAQADPPFEPVVVARAPNDPEAGATLCTQAEDVIISCRLKDSAQIASICIAPVEVGEPRKVRFVQGLPEAPPSLEHDVESGDSAKMFRRTHLFRAGPTGGFAYTFDHGGSRYGFYSEEGSYHALAGLFQAQPASPKVISHQLCDMETLVETYDRELIDFTRTWQQDPLIDEYDVPLVPDSDRR